MVAIKWTRLRQFITVGCLALVAVSSTSGKAADSLCFQTAVSYAAGDGPLSVFAADFDGDSDLDLAIANANSGDVSVLLNCALPPCGAFLEISPIQNLDSIVVGSQIALDVIVGSSESIDSVFVALDLAHENPGGTGEFLTFDSVSLAGSNWSMVPAELSSCNILAFLDTVYIAVEPFAALPADSGVLFTVWLTADSLASSSVALVETAFLGCGNLGGGEGSAVYTSGGGQCQADTLAISYQVINQADVCSGVLLSAEFSSVPDTIVALETMKFDVTLETGSTIDSLFFASFVWGRARVDSVSFGNSAWPQLASDEGIDCHIYPVDSASLNGWYGSPNHTADTAVVHVVPPVALEPDSGLLCEVWITPLAEGELFRLGIARSVSSFYYPACVPSLRESGVYSSGAFCLVDTTVGVEAPILGPNTGPVVVTQRMAKRLRVPSQFERISFATNIAITGDTVSLSPGTYTEAVQIDDAPQEPLFALLAADDWIDGNFTGEPSVVWTPLPDTNALLVLRDPTGTEGLAVAGIKFEDAERSALYSIFGLTVEDCWFINNIDTTSYQLRSGAAISIEGGFGYQFATRITRSRFEGNVADSGGAVFIYDGSSSPASIEDCLFTTNFARGTEYGPAAGGAIMVANSSGELTIRNNTFYMNETVAWAGSALALDVSGQKTIENSVFVGNRAFDTSSLGPCGIDTSLTVRNNLIFDNTRWLMYQGQYCPELIGTDFVNADPLFVDAATGDFRLQPGSPAIDAGDPSSPLDPDGTRADIGAFFFDQRDCGSISATLLSPESNAVVTPSPLFEWFAVCLGSEYEVVVALDPLLDSSIWQTSTPYQELAYGGPPLQPGRDYYWSVRGLGAAGWGPWTSPWEFSLASQVDTLPAPSLQFPTSGDSVALPEVFLWTGVTGAESYRIDVRESDTASTSLFTADYPILNGTVPQTTSLINLDSAVWRVQAIDTLGYPGYWSSFEQFHLIPPHGPPGIPVPNDPDTSLSDTLIFSWSSVSGANCYQIEISTDSTFSSPQSVYEVCGGDVTFAFPLPGGEAALFWQVRACNASGCSEWAQGPGDGSGAGGGVGLDPGSGSGGGNGGEGGGGDDGDGDSGDGQGGSGGGTGGSSPPVASCVTYLTLLTPQDTVFLTLNSDTTFVTGVKADCEDTITLAWLFDSALVSQESVFGGLGSGQVPFTSPAIPTASLDTFPIQCRLVEGVDTFTTNEVIIAVVDQMAGPDPRIKLSPVSIDLPADGSSQQLVEVRILDQPGSVWVMFNLTTAGSLSADSLLVNGIGSFTYTSAGVADSGYLIASASGLSADSIRIELSTTEGDILAAEFQAVKEKLENLTLGYQGDSAVLSAVYDLSLPQAFVDTALLGLTVPDSTDLRRQRLVNAWLRLVLLHWDHPNQSWFDGDPWDEKVFSTEEAWLGATRGAQALVGSFSYAMAKCYEIVNAMPDNRLKRRRLKTLNEISTDFTSSLKAISKSHAEYVRVSSRKMGKVLIRSLLAAVADSAVSKDSLRSTELWLTASDTGAVGWIDASDSVSFAVVNVLLNATPGEIDSLFIDEPFWSTSVSNVGALLAPRHIPQDADAFLDSVITKVDGIGGSGFLKFRKVRNVAEALTTATSISKDVSAALNIADNMVPHLELTGSWGIDTSSQSFSSAGVKITSNMLSDAMSGNDMVSELMESSVIGSTSLEAQLLAFQNVLSASGLSASDTTQVSELFDAIDATVGAWRQAMSFVGAQAAEADLIVPRFELEFLNALAEFAEVRSDLSSASEYLWIAAEDSDSTELSLLAASSVAEALGSLYEAEDAIDDLLEKLLQIEVTPTVFISLNSGQDVVVSASDTVTTTAFVKNLSPIPLLNGSVALSSTTADVWSSDTVFSSLAPGDSVPVTVDLSLNPGASGQGVVLTIEVQSDLAETDLTATFATKLSCCLSLTGDVNCDGGVGLPDLSTLIDNLFITFAELCCDGEADVNADGSVGLPDLSTLIDHLFITFTPLPFCL